MQQFTRLEGVADTAAGAASAQTLYPKTHLAAQLCHQCSTVLLRAELQHL